MHPSSSRGSLLPLEMPLTSCLCSSAGGPVQPGANPTPLPCNHLQKVWLHLQGDRPSPATEWGGQFVSPSLPLFQKKPSFFGSSHDFAGDNLSSQVSLFQTEKDSGSYGRAAFLLLYLALGIWHILKTSALSIIIWRWFDLKKKKKNLTVGECKGQL